MFAGLVIIAIFSALALTGLFLVASVNIAEKQDQELAAELDEFHRFMNREIFTAPKFSNN